MSDDSARATRRAWLASVSGATLATAGCLGELRRVTDRDAPNRLSLDILTLPSDDNLYALRIANHLAGNLEQAGIQADVSPTRRAPFLRDVLINLAYDLYVWRHPGQLDPDYLRPFLHSRFAEEPGWQNPFSFSDRQIDEGLEAQVRGGASREARLKELQRDIGAARPFVPIAFEDDQRLARTDRLQPRWDVPFDDPLWLLLLDYAEENENRTVRLGSTNGTVTQNLNPIAAEFRGSTDVTDLIYEPLARPVGEEYIPWVAADWEWVSPKGARAPTMEVRIRPGLQWQDGEPLTARDVVFTYRFLADTSMTEEDPQIPAPRFRGRGTLIDAIEAVDDRVLRLQYIESGREIARRLLTVPILPQHVWEQRTGLSEVAGIPVSDVTTDALIADNLDPVGSGPYRVVEVEADNLLRLEHVSDHFLAGIDATADPAGDFASPAIQELVIDVRPSVTNLVDAIVNGDLDGGLCDVGRELFEEHRDPDGPVDGAIQETTRLMHLGMNLRVSPLTNHGFRGAVAALIDREYVIEDIYRGRARATRSPLVDESIVPSELAWGGEDRQFAGEPGTGEVDPDEARELFREAGFQYDEDGYLLSR